MSVVEISNRTTGARVSSSPQVTDVASIRQMQDYAREVPIAEHVTGHAVKLVLASHPEEAGAPESV